MIVKGEEIKFGSQISLDEFLKRRDLNIEDKENKMKRLSAMGSSKYEFEPWKFDEDIRKKRENHRRKKNVTMETLEKLINMDTWQEDNWRIIINCLKELKNKYDL